MNEISEIPMIEQAPSTKINQRDLERSITNLARTVGQESGKSFGQPETVFAPAASEYIKSSDETTLRRLKNLAFEKAGKALMFSVDKFPLAASAASFLVSIGCGNVENQNIPPSTPIPAVSEFPGGMPSANIEFTDSRIAPEVPVSPTPTPEPTPASIPVPSFPTSSIETPTLTSLAPSPTRESSKPPEYEYLTFDSIKVAIDKEGFPVKYISPDGKKVSFDKKEVKRLREKAIASKEPEIIKIIPWSVNREDAYKPSIEDPRTSELPKDTLSEEELEKRGIKIIQANNTNLYIREGAFAKGSQLADFNSISDRKLTIVLVNGPFLSRDFMKDDRYNGVREYISTDEPYIQEQTLSSYKKEIIESLEEKLSGYSKEAKNLGSMAGYPDSWMKKYQGKIYSLKRDIYVLRENVLKKKQISDKMLLAPKGAVLGVYKEGDYYTLLEQKRAGMPVQHELDSVSKESFIFITVGKTPILNGAVFAFDEKGQLMVENNNLLFPYADLELEARDTHPNPTETKIIHGSGELDYLYGVDSIGRLLRHEVAHDELTAQKLEKGGISNSTEHDTDIQYMKGIRDAWEKWESSGFKDNSGYYFVFGLPKGGYILTENKQSNASSPRET